MPTRSQALVWQSPVQSTPAFSVTDTWRRLLNRGIIANILRRNAHDSDDPPGPKPKRVVGRRRKTAVSVCRATAFQGDAMETPPRPKLAPQLCHASASVQKRHRTDRGAVVGRPHRSRDILVITRLATSFAAMYAQQNLHSLHDSKPLFQLRFASVRNRRRRHAHHQGWLRRSHL